MLSMRESPLISAAESKIKQQQAEIGLKGACRSAGVPSPDDKGASVALSVGEDCGIKQSPFSPSQQMSPSNSAELEPKLTPNASIPQDDENLKNLLAGGELRGPEKHAEIRPSVKIIEQIRNGPTELQTIELRFLVRRREAGALIGKKGANIKRLRETFRSSMFSIPDTGNGPERVVCIVTDEESIDMILTDFTQLFMEKSPENEEQIELKLLIHSSHAGSIIGIGGQSIKKLRNDSKAAIKIYEMCCPLSNERVCAIKAKPAVVVKTIRLIQSIFNENPIKGTIKPYDALNFDLNLIEKYGGYMLDDTLPLDFKHLHHHRLPQPGAPLQAYPSYLSRVPVRQQTAAMAFGPRQLAMEQQGSWRPTLPKGYLSCNQNYSLWRAAEPSSSSPQVEQHRHDKAAVLTGQAESSNGKPEANSMSHPEQGSQRLLMLKPRGSLPNGKNFGPINNHNGHIARLNPYARSYSPARHVRSQVTFFPGSPYMLQHQQQAQRHFHRNFVGQTSTLEEGPQVDLIIDGAGRCPTNNVRPYLCMFYPTLPNPHRQSQALPADLPEPLAAGLTIQQAQAPQTNWLPQIHLIQQPPTSTTSPTPNHSNPGSHRQDQQLSNLTTATVTTAQHEPPSTSLAAFNLEK